MAEESINFLRRRRQQALRFRQLDRRILQGSILAAVVAVGITGGLVVFTQLRSRELAQIQQTQRSTQALVNQQAGNEAEYLLYAARLTLLNDILVDRGSQRRALEFLGELTSSDVAFDRINYDDDKKQIVFRVKAQNVLAVDRFLERLRAPDTRAKFVDLTLSDVQRDEEQIYSMEITVQLDASEETGGSQRG